MDGEARGEGNDVDVLVRPEAVRLTADDTGDARVVATAFLGAVTRVTVRLADGTEVKADLPTHEAAALGAGHRRDREAPGAAGAGRGAAQPALPHPTPAGRLRRTALQHVAPAYVDR